MNPADFNRHRIPSGGWQYFQPQTNWRLPTPIASTFDQSVQLIIQHRMANKAITMKHNLATVPEVVASELEQFNRRRLGIGGDAQAPFRAPRSQYAASGAVAAGVKLANQVKNTGAGIGLVMDWLGTGLKPVDRELAEKRAEVCAGCPQNQPGNLMQRLDGWAAEDLRLLIGMKNDLSLATSNDDKLQSCQACDCFLKLKVHAPLAHVLKRLRPASKEKLDPRCWILHEVL